MLKTKIIEHLKKTISTNLLLDPAEIEPEVFTPDNEKFGHYSTNVALKLAKNLKKNPLEIAHQINSELKNSKIFSKIEVASPGFINFWLKPELLQKELKEILKKKKNYGQPKAKSSKLKTVNIEFISANPTGQLTIGNGRGGFLGDALANLLEFSGFKVTREYYINDAKASNQIKELGKTALGKGETYKTSYLQKKIKLIKKELQGKSESEAGYLLAQEVMKDIKNFITKRLKIKFDVWFSEESLYQKKAIDKLLEKLEKKGLIYKKEGAIWFKTAQFGDTENRVLIRKTGEPTYFLSDLAYFLNKLEGRKFNKIINIWGADHHGYELRLRAALKALGIADDKFKAIITQMVRLVKEGKEIKMSKRKGEYFTLEELIKEIGLDATRFFFLMYSPDTHMDFDLGLAKKKSMKNPVYYVQYAAVRCQSIIKKISKSKLLISQQIPKNEILKFLNTAEDLDLIRMLVRFPEKIEEATTNYNPQVIIRYSLDLAKKFHNFYEKEKVITENQKTTFARLILIKSTLIVFQNIFSILGISLPKKM